MTDEDAVAVAQRMIEKVDTLGDKVDRLAEVYVTNREADEKVNRRWRVVTIALGLLVIGVLCLGATNFLTARSVSRQSRVIAAQTAQSVALAACERQWAVATSNRTNALLPLSNARSDALDDFVTSLGSKDQAQIEKAYGGYLKASDKYKRAQLVNPVPLAPNYSC